MLKNSFIYLFSSLAGKATPFLLLPVLTTYLSPTEFGLVALFQLSIQLAQSLSGLSLNVNIPRFFFSQSKEKSAELIFDLYFILLLSSFVLFVLLAVVSLFVDDYFGLPASVVFVLPILAFMSMSNLLSQTLLRTMERPVSFMYFEIGFAVTNLILVISFVVFLNLSWEGQVLAISSTLVSFGLLAIWNVWRLGYVKVDFDFSWVKNILLVSIPLIPHAIAGVVISVSDRLFLEKMVSASAVGVYSVGYYFGMVVMLFSDSFIKAWNPWFFKKLSSSGVGERLKVVKYTYAYVIVLILGAFAYSELAVFILPYVVSSEYLGAIEYIPWICFGYVFFGIYQIFFPYYVFMGKTTFVAFATVIAACVNLVGNYFFIQEFGVVGAAYSTVLALAVSAVLVASYAVGQVKMPWLLRGGD